MTDIERQIKAALQRGHGDVEEGRVPDFDRAWAGAEARIGKRHRRIRTVGGLAAALTLIAVMFTGQLRPVEQEWRFIDPNEIAGGTSWVAPSDVLLPTHQFDIYRDIPVLIESTGTDGGALL